MNGDGRTTTGRTGSAVRSRPVDEINDLVRSIGAWMRAHFTSTVAGAGLTPPQAVALLELETPMPMGALAEALAFDASYITDIADQLEGRGLIERRTDPTDRRRKILALTPDGEALRSEISEWLRSDGGPITAGLSAEEQEQLRDLLLKVNEALEARPPSPKPESFSRRTG